MTGENMFKVRKNSKGFTLIELSIALVVIGIILGMVFKSRQLIEGARVKNMAAQYNKIIGGMNIYYERYGSYPGDGCGSATPADYAACTNAKDGRLAGGNEDDAFWVQLITNSKILSGADQNTPFGSQYTIYSGTVHGDDADWLSANNVALTYLCALDAMIDDGNADEGYIKDSNNANSYDSGDDCWSLTGNGYLRMQVLP